MLFLHSRGRKLDMREMAASLCFSYGRVWLCQDQSTLATRALCCPHALSHRNIKARRSQNDCCREQCGVWRPGETRCSLPMGFMCPAAGSEGGAALSQAQQFTMNWKAPDHKDTHNNSATFTQPRPETVNPCILTAEIANESNYTLEQNISDSIYQCNQQIR